MVEMRAALARKVNDRVHVEGVQATEIPGFSLYRRTEEVHCGSAAYVPRLIVFLQGRKRIDLGGRVYDCDGSTFLLTSVDLPVVSQITAASPKTPLLGLLLDLDMALVRQILSQEEMHVPAVCSDACGMAAGETTPELLDACSRLVDLADTPRDIPFLSGLIVREILYRLLCGPQGNHLRAIATLGEQSHRTARAIAWLRTNYAKPLRVEDLATLAQMGVSTFHHHFRSLTSMSPLQYQKRLRLHVARQRMLTGDLDAASAAFEVGYESPSQFNREYRRFFGQPPMRDVKAQRLTSTAGGSSE